MAISKSILFNRIYTLVIYFLQYMRSTFIFILILISCEVIGQQRPNIVLILADDMGWSDPGCYGNPIIQTPNIDQLAKEGMRFTNAYADPVCAPTRAMIQTGQYSAWLKLTGVPNGHRRPYAKLIPPEIYWKLKREHVTIAEAISEVGYTSGIFGKWHLGYGPDYQPDDQGYVNVSDQPFKGKYQNDLRSWIDANPEKLTGKILGESVKFIEQNKDQPFFCFVSFTAVHTKPEARKELVDKYKKIVANNRTTIDPTYAAMAEVMDEGIGWIRKALKENGLDKNTLIIFYSDNGGVIEERGFLFNGYPTLVTHNWPLRSEKGTLYEGGIRVPFVAVWPGQVKPGTTNDQMVHVVDFFPTILELTGAKVSKTLDGTSFISYLKNNTLSTSRDLFWHYPHYHHSTPASAIRSGDYKLIYFYETEAVELYNLKEDIGEQFDLSETQTDKAKSLNEKLFGWLESVDADMPEINPFYNEKLQLIWGERMDHKWYTQEQYDFGLK